MLISAMELKHLLDQKPNHLVVFDCRFSLKDESLGRTQYLGGHIPGAYYLHLNEDLSSPIGLHGGRHPLPTPDAFQAVMNRCGVNENSRIVVYDNGEGMATRAWWLLRYFGHNEVDVLDGGLRAWVSMHLPLSSAVPPVRLGDFTPHPHHDWVLSAEDVRRAVAGDKHDLLVDARSADRFRGENETVDPVAGHIPGAVNAPWTEGVALDGGWKTADEQRKRFEHLPTDRPWVMYCGSGVTACANLFALELAGFHNIRLYAGSWSDWITHSEFPIATGEE